MKNEYSFQLQLPLPPPVVFEYIANPWLFFNPMAHIAVLKKITGLKWDIIFSPDVEQSRGTTYYGILDGPVVKGETVNYKCRSIDNSVAMEISINVRPKGVETYIDIQWGLETSLGFIDKIMGESFSLTPEHIFKKHLSLRIPEILNLINYREQGREFLLEKVLLNGATAIPYIKNKAREIGDCIILGTSKNLNFKIEVREGQLLTIHSESGNRENFGGEAILEILNNSDEMTICFYHINAKEQTAELIKKQISLMNN